MLCDKNCFSCKWDDCINDEITPNDTKEIEEMDKWLFPEEEKRKKHYRDNREYYREKNREWHRKNRDKATARKREWRMRRKEKRG